MGAVLDLFNVLHEPTAVFGRLKEKPRWFLVTLAVIVLLMLNFLLLKPFVIAAFQGMFASMPPEQLARAPKPDTQWLIQLLSTPIFGFVIVFAGAGLLWVATAVSGTEGKYKVLLSVFAHANITFVLYSIVTTLVLMTRGVGEVSTMADLRPALGLDLLAPNAGKFLGAFLNGINPFSLWGVWLTGTGVSVTHGTSRGTGITAATIAFLIGLAILSAFAMFQPG